MAELTPEDRAAVLSFFEEGAEVIGSVGRHGGHTLSRVGRCVYCSCGYRYQGTLPSREERAECAAAFAARQPPD
jgi:hypothetical protein